MLNYQLLIFFTATDIAALSPNRTKTLLANALITFFVNDSPVFNNGPRSLPKNSADYIILDYWIFDNLILVDESFVKPSQRFAPCLLVDTNLWGKWVSLSELRIIFDDNLKTTSALFFTVDFNLLSYQFDCFTFKLLHWAISYW